MEDFKYSPLLPFSADGNPSIRLVELQPCATSNSQPLIASTQDLIRANVINAHLGEGEPYETLSYCWGNPSVKCRISLNGLNFSVTTNLHSALRRLQKEDGVRRIWIDAICVDQSDIDERNEQVRLMRQIYSTCSRCLVWLGEFAEDVSQGVGIISTIGSLRHAMEEMGDTLENLRELPSEGNELILQGLGLSVDEIQQWESLDRIVNAPWFRRVWIIQEITFPPIVTILCGDAELDWDETVATMSFGERLGLLSSAPNPNRVMLKGKYGAFRELGGMRLKGQEEHLVQLLLRFRGFGATDARDNIFALMNLNEGSKRNKTYPSSTPEPMAISRPKMSGLSKQFSIGSLMDRKRDKLLVANAFYQKVKLQDQIIEFLKIEQELGIITEDIKRNTNYQQIISENETSEDKSRRREAALAAVKDPERLLTILHRSADLANAINKADGVEPLSREDTLERILHSRVHLDVASLDLEGADEVDPTAPKESLFEPDYNLTDVEVYTITMDKLLCVSGNLSLLMCVDSLPSEPERGSVDQKFSVTSRLPSWVIDWSKTMETFPLGLQFSASSKTSHVMLPGEIDGRLLVQGHKLDTISHIPPTPLQSTWTPLFSFSDWKALAHAEYLKDRNPDAEQIDEAFCHTVMGGLLAKRTKEIDYRLEDVLAFVAIIEKSERVVGTLADLYIEKSEKMTKIMTNMTNVCKKRKLVILETGRMGLVPGNAEVGDKIFLLKGGDVPFILREEGEGIWRLGGHCYVHGVMFGEAFEEQSCREMILI